MNGEIDIFVDGKIDKKGNLMKLETIVEISRGVDAKSTDVENKDSVRIISANDIVTYGCRYASHLATTRISIWPLRASTLGHLTHSLFGHFFFLMRT